MVIDKEQLISLLTEKTGLEREQVQTQLSELIARIQKAAEQGKKFEVEGFGTFSMEEDTLQFEPSDTLETEINNKYAGMKPIELIGAFKQPEGDEIPDMDEEKEEERQIWAYDDTASVEDEPEEESEPLAKSAEEQTGDETKKIDDTDEGDADSEAEEEDPDKIFETTFESAEPGPESSEKDLKTHPQTESEKEPKYGKEERDAEKESDLIGQLLVAAVIIIALGVGGWLVYDTGFIGGDNDSGNNPSQQVTGKTTQQAGASARQTGGQQNKSPEEAVVKKGERSKNPEPEEGKKVASNESSQSQTETQQNVYGLRGDLEQSIDNGYTIVVYSLTDIDRAEKERKKLRQAGYRALINTVEVNGKKYYRVGVGQFQTVDAAQQAVEDIPKSFQGSSNHFIKRIQ